MSTQRNTQLTSAIGYDTDNMIFSEPNISTIPTANVPITLKRIPISTRNPDGSIGDLIIGVKGFSFGVQENKDFNTGKPNGYQFPISLYTKGAVTEEEKEWVQSFERIVDKCKQHLVANRKAIQKYDLEERDLKKLNPIYWKRIDGEIAPDASPVFYVKLITKNDKTTGEKIIRTQFYDENGDKINPLDIQNKMCNAEVALKIESLFIGNKISLQVKLYEANVQLIETGMKRLLSTSTAPRRILNTSSTRKTVAEKTEEHEVKDDSGDDAGSIADDDEETEEKEAEDEEEEVEEVVEKPKKKKVVKRVVKKVKKKSN